MAVTHSLTAEVMEGELLLTRSFNAPRELVWQAWTDPNHLQHWWGPKGCSISVKKFELRPGGTFHYSMRTPGGEMWGKFVYQEIEEPEFIIFINSFADEEGNTIRAPFSELWPLEVMNRMTLTEQDGVTTLTLRGRPHNASEAEEEKYYSFVPSMEKGFGGTFDQLEEYLATM